MILKQYYLACLSHASYLIADETSKCAAIVDPQRDIDQYLEDATAQGLKIEHVLLTHFHADFVAGHLELRKATGAEIHLGAQARADYPFTSMSEDAGLALGPAVALSFLQTPGHTPEGVSIVVHDLAGGEDRTHAVMTGDTMFIGDVGRPDLMASIGVTAEELAEQLFDSLHEKLLKLPDETLVYPAHGAGSMCGRSLSTETVSTIGKQRQLNYALQPMSREDFIALVTANQPNAPAYFAFDAQRNKEERPVLDETLARALHAMTLDEALEHQRGGALLLDTREADVYAPRHLAGSLNIGLGGRYATWAGTLIDRDRPIVLVTEPGTQQEAAMRLGRIGYDNVVGYLDRGPAAFAAREDAVRQGRRIDFAELDRMRASDSSLAILDVRAPAEFEAGAIPGAVNIPLQQLAAHVDEVPAGRPLVVHCKGGYRSSAATSILEAAGLEGMLDLSGGYDAWAAANLTSARE